MQGPKVLVHGVQGPSEVKIRVRNRMGGAGSEWATGFGVQGPGGVHGL